jgi:tetratricopeptide (TPR) repeat protein
MLTNIGYEVNMSYTLRHLSVDETLAWNNKAWALQLLGRYNESLEFINKAIDLNPNSATIWDTKGFALSGLGKPKGAIECYDKAIELDQKDAIVWNHKGGALKELGKYDEAIQAYDEALRLDPTLVTVWSDKASILMELKKYEEALQAFDEAITINPRDAEIWYDKSNLLVRLGRTNEAKDAYSKAKKLGWNVLPFVESPAGKHSCRIGTPGISEFVINWTDNKNYVELERNVFEGGVSRGLESWDATGYFLQAIENAAGNSTTALDFSIHWNPEEKYPSTWSLFDTDEERISVTDITIQGKKAILAKFKERKSYQGPDTLPETIPASFLVSYCPDEHTKVTIRAPASEWKDSEFKAAISSLKVTPPAGYY